MHCGSCGVKLEKETKFCPKCGEKSYGDPDIEQLNERLERLEKLEVNSPKFVIRALSIWGHYFVASLIIGLIFALLAVFFGILFQ